MATEKNQNLIAWKISYEKRLSEINLELIELKQKNPNLITFEDMRKLNVEYKFKMDKQAEKYKECQVIVEQINDLGAKLKTSSEKNNGRLHVELKSLYDRLDIQKKEYEEISLELDNLGKLVEFSSSQENKKYIEVSIDREKIKKKLDEINQSLLEKSLDSPINMQAAEKKSSPFGPVLINKNLLENITKSTQWQKEFSIKHNLEIIKEDKPAEKIQFVSKEKDIRMVVKKEEVSGQWKKENEQIAIQMMVELYLKSIANQIVTKHKVEGENSETTQLIELELAKQLKAQGIGEAEINEKTIEDVINTKSSRETILEDSQTNSLRN